MRTATKAFLMALLCLLACTGSSFAGLGLGGFIQGGQGSGQFEFDFGPEIDLDVALFGVGFALDTDISDAGTFNYRLNVGLAVQDLDFDFLSEDLELFGVAVDNNFGFAVVRKPEFRLWIGPQVRIGLYGGETSIGGFDVYAVEFGVGPVVGGNFVLNNRVAFSLSGGARFTGMAGQVDPFEEDFVAGTAVGFLNFAVLFGVGR